LPPRLMEKDLRFCSSWAQQVKQMAIIMAGIETKRQGDMSKGERACFIAQEYGGWCKTLKTKYPDASVNRFMAFTTGKCTTSIDGAYLYRNFQEGLRIFHNEWNSLWAEILAGQISTKDRRKYGHIFYTAFGVRRKAPILRASYRKRSHQSISLAWKSRNGHYLINVWAPRESCLTMVNATSF